MVIDRGLVSKWVLAAVVMLGAVGLGGCGKSESNQRWIDLQHIYMDREAMLEASQASGGEEGYGDSAAALDFMLSRNSELPENFRRAIESLRDLEQRLADGTADADDREQAEQYWSHLTSGNLPPEYR